jgi:hypothetical protein
MPGCQPGDHGAARLVPSAAETLPGSNAMVGNALGLETGDALPTPPNSRRLRNRPYVPPLRIVRSLLLSLYDSRSVLELVMLYEDADNLRGVAASLQGMSDSQVNAYVAAHREIRIRLMSGKEFVLSTINSRSSWFDLHRETRRAIGIPLAASSISIRITLIKDYKDDSLAWPSGRGVFSLTPPRSYSPILRCYHPGDIMPCHTGLCGSVVRGCVFQVITHKPTSRDDPAWWMLDSPSIFPLTEAASPNGQNAAETVLDPVLVFLGSDPLPV